MKTRQLIIVLCIFLLGGFYSKACKAQAVDDSRIIPNVFSPNNDGINDSFKVDFDKGSWVLMIFDRWGSLVYASEQGQGAAWNGVNLQGIEADEGVYFYTLKELNTDKSYNGSLHLFR